VTVVAVLCAITAAKLLLATLPFGTGDIDQFRQQGEAYLAGRDLFDPASTAQNPSFFPLLHYMIGGAMLALWQLAGGPVSFWFKLPAILSDLGIALVLRRSRAGDAGALTYMLSPLSLLLGVYHGQPHTIVAFGGTAATWLAVRGRTVAAAVAVALTASVRQNFGVLLVPVLVRAQRSRLLAAGAFAVVTIVINAPLVASAHLERGLTPPWTFGVWGYPLFLVQGPRLLALVGMPVPGLSGFADGLLRFGFLLYFAWAVVFSLWVWRRPHVDHWHAALVFFLGFYVIGPGFGVQWLIWALPFWIVVDRRGGTIYGMLGGIFAAGLYWVWTFNQKYGVASVTANLSVLGRVDLLVYVAVGALGVVTWLYCVRGLWTLAGPILRAPWRR
jgi:hypothetical protein